jgi:hypothetical protein
MKNLEVPLQVAIMAWINNIQWKDLNQKLNIKPRYIGLYYRHNVEHCSCIVTLGVSKTGPRLRHLAGHNCHGGPGVAGRFRGGHRGLGACGGAAGDIPSVNKMGQDLRLKCQWSRDSTVGMEVMALTQGGSRVMERRLSSPRQWQ